MPLGNEDNLIGQSVGKQGFTISGGQFGLPGERVNGKTPTLAPPMSINNHHAGLFAEDDSIWGATFGSSLDSYLTLFNGAFLKNSIDSIAINGIYKQSLTTAEDNIYEKVNGVQQIQYVVSKSTVDAASSLDNFGEINEARSIGIRIPMMAAGWGRTTNLLPTDPVPTEDDGRGNDYAHKLDRATWKHGPIDLRWDEKRQVWTAFNDLIADHEGVGLGTWLFGTNSDLSRGFPFVRARLEDVLWIRQTNDTKDGTLYSSSDKTARAFTHLQHKWFDNDENGSAPLSSIFCIPHNSTSDYHSKIQRPEHSLGNETTGDDHRIDIKHRVHFINVFDADKQDGPIHFSRGIIKENNIASVYTYADDAEEKNEILGTMRFNALTGTWMPSIPVNECDLVGGHFKKLIKNDWNIVKRMTATCNKLAEITTNMCNVIRSNDAQLSTTDAAITNSIKNTLVPAINAALMTLALEIDLNVEAGLSALATEVEAGFQEFYTALAAQLLENCGCSISVDPPTITATHYSTTAPSITYNFTATATLNRPEPFNCVECIGVTLEAPCMDQPQYTASAPCAGIGDDNISTKYGGAQLKNKENSPDQTYALSLLKNNDLEVELDNQPDINSQLSTRLG